MIENLCSFDLETTGADPLEARIVSATAAHLGAAGAGPQRSWLVWPGVEIPAAATAIHGITSERARTHGEPSETAAPAIAAELLGAWALIGKAVVIFNAPYDLTVLQRELERHEHPPLEVGPVLDPLVIDRACEPYRKGKRTLAALADYYGVEKGAAHDSHGDAVTAARILWRQLTRYRGLMPKTLKELQPWQAEKYRAWADGFEKYLRGQGKQDVIDRDWPVRRPKGAA